SKCSLSSLVTWARFAIAMRWLSYFVRVGWGVRSLADTQLREGGSSVVQRGVVAALASRSSPALEGVRARLAALGLALGAPDLGHLLGVDLHVAGVVELVQFGLGYAVLGREFLDVGALEELTHHRHGDLGLLLLDALL